VTPLREKRHGFGRSFIRYYVSVKMDPELKIVKVNLQSHHGDQKYQEEPVDRHSDG
jgi:hypothetical protein